MSERMDFPIGLNQDLHTFNQDEIPWYYDDRGLLHWKDENEERADAEPDDIELLIDKAQQQVKTAVGQWTKAIASWLDTQDSLESAKQALQDDPVPLYDKLNGKKFADTLAQTMLLADLVGQSQVQDESRTDSLSDMLPIREDARPGWLRLPFQEAIDYFRKKVIIPADDYKEMQEGYHDWAFSISGIARADVLEDAKWLIDQALTEGNSFEVFQKQWGRLIGRKAGWNPGEKRLYTIFDTNIRSATGTGRGKQMLDPDVADRRPYILWRWRDSPNPRLNHQALNNKAIASNSTFWQQCRFPSGWGCRCSGFSVSADYCRRNGIEILDNPPDPSTIAEPGFRYPLAGLSDQQRQQQINEMVDKVDPRLQERIRKAPGSQTS